MQYLKWILKKLSTLSWPSNTHSLKYLDEAAAHDPVERQQRDQEVAATWRMWNSAIVLQKQTYDSQKYPYNGRLTIRPRDS